MGAAGTRPRAISFIRKVLVATQIYPSPQNQINDYCFVQVCGVMFINLYRVPGFEETLDPLLRWSPSGPVV